MALDPCNQIKIHIVMTIKIDLRILFFIVFALPIIAGAQNTWIADNRPGAPSGDFVATTLQAAIDSASNGYRTVVGVRGDDVYDVTIRG